MAEIAAEGGALVADPRDWDALLEQTRRLLADDALVKELAAQAARRRFADWETYAADVWRHLVGDEPHSPSTQEPS